MNRLFNAILATNAAMLLTLTFDPADSLTTAALRWGSIFIIIGILTPKDTP